MFFYLLRVSVRLSVFLLFFILSLAATLPSIAGQVQFQWAVIGNAGNAADPRTGSQHGDVDYEYRIGKTEVTNRQYAAFLNKVDPDATNALSLYSYNMASDFGGIRLDTTQTSGSRYTVTAGRANKPVTYVSWISAARFTNWLHNGQGTQSSSNPTITETGAYSIVDGTIETRSSGAKYFLPNEDEWYKAAYHDASAGLANAYFLYANSSNSKPISDHPDDRPWGVNYHDHDGRGNGFNDGYAVLRSFFINGSPLADAGAYANAVSPYGTYDQSGSLWEWLETTNDNQHRRIRGGSWVQGFNNLKSTRWDQVTPDSQSAEIGFRIAAAPVPNPAPIAGISLLMTLIGLKRKR